MISRQSEVGACEGIGYMGREVKERGEASR